MALERSITHPGEILREDFLVPMGISADALSTALGVPASRILDIVNERQAVSADTAARLARFFGTSARYWLDLQAEYDLSVIRKTKQQELQRIVPWKPVPAESSAVNA